jgi:hypothetical protein
MRANRPVMVFFNIEIFFLVFRIFSIIIMRARARTHTRLLRAGPALPGYSSEIYAGQRLEIKNRRSRFEKIGGEKNIFTAPG